MAPRVFHSPGLMAIDNVGTRLQADGSANMRENIGLGMVYRHTWGQHSHQAHAYNFESLQRAGTSTPSRQFYQKDTITSQPSIPSHPSLVILASPVFPSSSLRRHICFTESSWAGRVYRLAFVTQSVTAVQYWQGHLASFQPHPPRLIPSSHLIPHPHIHIGWCPPHPF